MWKSSDLLQKLDKLHEMMMSGDLPSDLNGAKVMMELHNRVKVKVTKAPIESLEADGHRILQRIRNAAAHHHGRTSGWQ